MKRVRAIKRKTSEVSLKDRSHFVGSPCSFTFINAQIGKVDFLRVLGGKERRGREIGTLRRVTVCKRKGIDNKRERGRFPKMFSPRFSVVKEYHLIEGKQRLKTGHRPIDGIKKLYSHGKETIKMVLFSCLNVHNLK